MRRSITVCRSGMVSSPLERRICLTKSSSFSTPTSITRPYSQTELSLLESHWRFHLMRLSNDEKELRKGEDAYARHKEDVMFKKSFVMISLTGISLVAMLGTEAMGQGYRFCYGCGSGDACQLETPLGGLLTSIAIVNGLVSMKCDTRLHGAGVRTGHVICVDQGGNVAPGLPIQGNANGT